MALKENIEAVLKKFWDDHLFDTIDPELKAELALELRKIAPKATMTKVSIQPNMIRAVVSVSIDHDRAEWVEVFRPGRSAMKMYILVLDELPLGYILPAIGHAVLACHYEFGDRAEMVRWRDSSFVKVVCKVNRKEWEKAKEFEDRVVMTESKLAGAETVMCFMPREEWPKPFRFYKLYR